MTTLAERIRLIRNGLDMTQLEFARAVENYLKAHPVEGQPDTVSRGAIANWERGGGIDHRNLDAIANLANLSYDWIANGRGAMPALLNLNGSILPPSPQPPSDVRPADVRGPRHTDMSTYVPLLGTAAGSAVNNGAFQLTPDTIDYVLRPPGLAHATDIYALYVENDSMVPRYPNGELIFVSPNRPVRVGDPVVIQEPVRGTEHEFRAYLKIFMRQTPQWVVATQYNPPAELKFKRTAGIRIHRVLTMAEVMGA